MTADALQKITTDALDTLAALLDEGHSDRLTALFRTMARFHKYSFHNLCLITAQYPTATRVAGFHAWRAMGRFVRKGEKGIAILAPIVGRRNTDATDDDSKTGRAYQQIVHAIDVPTDILARMPPELQRPLRTVYATIELADGIAKRGIDQVGATRAIGAPVLQTIRFMEQDAASTLDAFNTETALLNKINAASVLGLRLADQSNQFLLNTVEQLLVDTTRKRDTEAAVLDATIHQWRYGQAYGADLFRNTATAMDTWRMR